MHPATIHIAIPVAAALITNAIIYLKGWNRNSSQITSPLLPPGPIIGTVWIFIFASLGYAHYLLTRSKNKLAAYAVIAIIIWCLLYPFLTSGLQSSKRSKLLNTISLILAATLTTLIAATSNDLKPLFYTIPILIWTSYVNISDVL